MMIVPVTCDCKKKIAGMLGDYCDVMWDPPVITDNSFDGMIRALANRSIRPCPCPTFADNTPV